LSQDGSRGVPRVVRLGRTCGVRRHVRPLLLGEGREGPRGLGGHRGAGGNGLAHHRRGRYGETATQTATHRPRTVRPGQYRIGPFPCTQGQTALRGIPRCHGAPPVLSPETRVRIPVAVPRQSLADEGLFISGLRPGPKLCPEFVPKSAFGGNRRFAWKAALFDRALAFRAMEQRAE
jgi:hypothetical protein